MDRDREYEEPFGFDGRSLEEQLAALSSADTEYPQNQPPPGRYGRGAGAGQPDYQQPHGTASESQGGEEPPTGGSEPGRAAEAAQAPRLPDAPQADGEPWPGQQAGPPPLPPEQDLGPQSGRAPWNHPGGEAWPPGVPYEYPAENGGHPDAEQYAGGPPQYPGGQYVGGHPQYPGDPAWDVSPETPQTADNLKPETLLRGRRRAPSRGWRRAVYRGSFGFIHPGESPAELRRRELAARARTVVAGGHHRVAVVSLKGGVGKTTTTIGLGSTLAALRGDRVVAVDANPDRGTLSDKLRLETAATVRDLLNEQGSVRRYADVRAFTSQAPSRLEVLASDRDPAVSEAFSEDDYRAVATLLERFYSICITDSGTGLLHSAMSGVLRLANQIVLVSSPSVDGARSASATLDWLEAHHFGRLVRNATVVLSAVHEDGKSSVDLNRLEQHFASRCNAVVRIPNDPHLEEGAEVELDELEPATREAYLLLAATVAGNFGHRPGVPISSSPAGDGYG